MVLMSPGQPKGLAVTYKTGWSSEFNSAWRQKVPPQDGQSKRRSKEIKEYTTNIHVEEGAAEDSLATATWDDGISLTVKGFTAKHHKEWFYSNAEGTRGKRQKKNHLWMKAGNT